MHIPVFDLLARKVARFMLILIAVIVACMLILVSILLIWSPGTPAPITDDHGRTLPGSISEKIRININGVNQGMFIRGKDSTNAVLLYLHGGMPEYFLTQKYPTAFEEYFTVCWWEQRGSGLSYDAHSLPPTADQLIADALELTKYLRNRFGKEKIFLLGHSHGSFIGIKAAARAPEMYYAYIGMAQISDQLKSERIAYEYMVDLYKRNGNKRMVERLEAAPVTVFGGIPASYLSIRDEAMHGLGVGTTHDMKSVLAGIFLPSLQFRQYTLGEKINLWRGKFKSGVSSVWNEIVTTDLTKRVTVIDIPVYFLHGKYDYTVSYQEANRYFKQLRAPLKGFYTFEFSAHSPLFEEPEKAIKILLEDVRNGTNELADK
jgi:pimeloyl-ACP methyl ester carboxylesterase